MLCPIILKISILTYQIRVVSDTHLVYMYHSM